MAVPGRPGSKDYFLALAAILGLLIDDMISNNKDFPVFLNLAEFWITSSNSAIDPEKYPMREFFVEQIRLCFTQA